MNKKYGQKSMDISLVPIDLLSEISDSQVENC